MLRPTSTKSFGLLSPENIQRILFDCPWTDNQISKEILVPCLNSYSIRNGSKLRDIRFIGGTSELGNDIEYNEIIGPDNLRFYTGIQVKKGDISQGEATTLIRQGTEAFEKELKDTSSGQKYRINRWIVAATGKISSQAELQISQQLDRYSKPVHFWNGLTLGGFIMDFYYREFIEKMGLESRLAGISNVRITYNDPDNPVLISQTLKSTEFKKIDIQRAVPISANGILLTVKPNDKNIPGVVCIVRSSIDEIVVDSLQSQLQPYLLKIAMGSFIEAKLQNEERAVNIYSRGYIEH